MGGTVLEMDLKELILEGKERTPASHRKTKQLWVAARKDEEMMINRQFEILEA